MLTTYGEITTTNDPVETTTSSQSLECYQPASLYLNINNSNNQDGGYSLNPTSDGSCFPDMRCEWQIFIDYSNPLDFMMLTFGIGLEDFNYQFTDLLHITNCKNNISLGNISELSITYTQEFQICVSFHTLHEYVNNVTLVDPCDWTITFAYTDFNEAIESQEFGVKNAIHYSDSILIYDASNMSNYATSLDMNDNNLPFYILE
uniref:CUB domain-containing protein n=1 Tax=Acrobeloides nanus TaxID=290746 RepID=A0A914CJS8_9BILA